MSKTIVPENESDHKPATIQIGPPWLCPTCAAPAARLACYEEFQNPRSIPKDLDRWGEHIWYLLGTGCSHPPRVARLGDAITTVVFPYDNKPHPSWRTEEQQQEDQREAIRLVRQALTTIVKNSGRDPQADQATSIVWSLMVGAMTPATAILEIHHLTKAETAQ